LELAIEPSRTVPPSPLFLVFSVVGLGIVSFGFQRAETMGWDAPPLETGAVIDHAAISGCNMVQGRGIIALILVWVCDAGTGKM
jgi:hypothetical protein